jgi:hypothetical protein
MLDSAEARTMLLSAGFSDEDVSQVLSLSLSRSCSLYLSLSRGRARS